MAAGITAHYGIIVAIGKHIISQQALSGGDIDVRIEEAACSGIIISALQVIQPGILVKLLPIVQFWLCRR